jgi:hypothetical protein
MGASLLVFLNKTDVEGCMTEEEVRRVSSLLFATPDSTLPSESLIPAAASTARFDQDT